MSKMNRMLHGTCLRKRPLSEDAARDIVRKASREGLRLFYYYCRICQHFHMTRQATGTMGGELQAKPGKDSSGMPATTFKKAATIKHVKYTLHCRDCRAKTPQPHKNFHRACPACGSANFDQCFSVSTQKGAPGDSLPSRPNP